MPDPTIVGAGPATGWLPELPLEMDSAHLTRAGGVQMPTSLLPDLFVDPLLGSQTGLQLPLPVHPVDTFMPPLRDDSSGAAASGSRDSQSPSHGSGPSASIPASAVVTSGQRRKAGAAGGKAKELTEEQKERIKAKNRRCVAMLGGWRGAVVQSAGAGAAAPLTSAAAVLEPALATPPAVCIAAGRRADIARSRRPRPLPRRRSLPIRRGSWSACGWRMRSCRQVAGCGMLCCAVLRCVHVHAGAGVRASDVVHPQARKQGWLCCAVLLLFLRIQRASLVFLARSASLSCRSGRRRCSRC